MSTDMDKGAALSIGEAAERTQLSRKAIRLYEKKGLLPPARRSDAGYRLYSGDDLDVLHFIRRAKALGLHLGEVGEILDLQRGGEQPCDRVLGLLDGRIAEIDRTVADLQQLRSALRTAREAAEAGRRRGQRSVVCRIIEDAPTDKR
ncbi:heavy metal-responsive transcriptional regulator [soil metagenome]